MFSHKRLVILGLILLVLIGLILALRPKPTDPQAAQALQRGDQLVAESRRTEARAAYQEAARRRPRDPQPWVRLGDLYLEWGQPESARDAYAEALSRGIDRGSVAPGLAQAYAALGLDRAAAQEWRNYLARRDDRAARLALARAYIRLSEWEAAQAELERLLDQSPDDAEAHVWLGLLWLGPDPERGIPHLQFAAADLAWRPFVAPFLEAERMAVASNDPAYRLTLLGAALTQADEIALARRVLSAATLLNPTYADAYAYLGQALDRAGLPDQAQAALDHARQLAAESEVALTLTGLFWDRRDTPHLARDYYFAAYERDRRNPTLCLEIAETFVAEGDYLGAEIWLNEAISLAPDDPQIWELVAHFYLDHRLDVEQAGVRSAIQWSLLAPNDPQAHDLLGWAFFLQGQEQAAEGQFLTALKLDPTLTSAYYHLGQLYAHQGRYSQALKAYLRANDHDIGGRLAKAPSQPLTDLGGNR